jgi:hypothetical protein
MPAFGRLTASGIKLSKEKPPFLISSIGCAHVSRPFVKDELPQFLTFGLQNLLIAADVSRETSARIKCVSVRTPGKLQNQTQSEGGERRLPLSLDNAIIDGSGGRIAQPG